MDSVEPAPRGTLGKGQGVGGGGELRQIQVGQALVPLGFVHTWLCCMGTHNSQPLILLSLALFPILCHSLLSFPPVFSMLLITLLEETPATTPSHSHGASLAGMD